MGGIPVAADKVPPMLRLYLMVSPGLDLKYRCLPRDGGLLDQDYEMILWFNLIEERVKEILIRKAKQMENEMRAKRR